MNVKEYLSAKGIEFKVFSHPPVYTCEEAKKYNQGIKGVHSKNLFLKDRKSRRYYLLIMPEDKALDLKDLGERLGDKLKFANENDLKEILGLTAGSVSPFGLLNDSEKKVEAVIDEEIWNSDYVSFHPNINTETLEITKEGFHKYIEALGNEHRIIENY